MTRCYQFVCSLMVACALWVASPAHAGILYFKLMGSQQDLFEAETRPGLTQSTAKKFKITTGDLLEMLADHYAETFPIGSALFLDDEGALFVVNQDGGIVLTIEENVFWIGAASDSVLIDTDSESSYRGSAAFLGAVDFSTDAEANHFSLSGPSRDQFTLSYRSGRYTYLWSVVAAGDGELDGVFTFITGSLNEKEIGILDL